MSDEPSPPKLSRLRLIGVKIGRSVAQNVAAALISSKVAAAAVVADLSAAATAMTVAEAQLVNHALAVLRVSVVGDVRVQRLTQLVSEYAAQNPAALADIQHLTVANSAALSLKGNLVGALVAGALQEAIAVAYYVSTPTADTADLKAATQQVVTTTVGSLACSAGGAAVGAVLLPGAGAVLGSLIGGFGGGYLSSVVAAKMTEIDPDRQRGYGPLDQERAFDPLTYDEGDFIVVRLSDAPSCRFESEPVSQASFVPSQKPGATPVTIDSVETGLSDLVLLFECIDGGEEDGTLSEEDIVVV